MSMQIRCKNRTGKASEQNPESTLIVLTEDHTDATPSPSLQKPGLDGTDDSRS